MKYHYDLHCHTTDSLDSCAKLERIVKVAKRRGLDGIAVTNHNVSYQGPTELDGIKIIPGIEITLKGGGHLLAYFIREEIEPRRTLKETVERIKSLGGYAVLAHPFRDDHGWIKRRTEDDISVEEALKILDGIETANASVSDEEREGAIKLGLVQTAGSDLHMPGQAGFSSVAVDQILTQENFIDQLKGADIILREESKKFRDEVIRGKRIIAKIARSLGLYNIKQLKCLFFVLVIKNYFRMKNLKLERIKFNLKES